MARPKDHDVFIVNEKGQIKETTTFEEFASRDRVPDCDCGLIVCACLEARKHKKGCTFLLALTCPVAFPCEAHDDEVCPECFACTCKETEHEARDR